jgi:hypothetical protein
MLFVGASRGVDDYYGAGFGPIAMPAGILPGDLLLMCSTWSQSWWNSVLCQQGIQPAAPRGWNLMGRDLLPGPTPANQFGYFGKWGRHLSAWRIADGTEQPLTPAQQWWAGYQGQPGWWVSASIVAYRGVSAPVAWTGDISESDSPVVGGKIAFNLPALQLATHSSVIFCNDSFDSWWPGSAPILTPAPGYVVDSNVEDTPAGDYAVHTWAHLGTPTKGTSSPSISAAAGGFAAAFAAWWGQAVVVNGADAGILLM